MRIGILGPEGSYSQKAAQGWTDSGISGQNPNRHSFVYYDDITDTFGSINDHEVDVAVVPVENSIEGSVGVTLDMLFEKDVTIIGEIIVPIRHCLLSRGNIENVKVILSHPQALAQCRQFIKDNFKHAQIRTTGSTSHAAKLANEFEEMAAIASREAADAYGLNILIPNIQDREINHTRFIVIIPGTGLSGNIHDRGPECKQKDVEQKDVEQKDVEQKDKIQENRQYPLNSDTYRTSMIIYIGHDRSGCLYEILGELAKRSVNMTRIESRPSKRYLGDYLFYIDIQGKASDENITEALCAIRDRVRMVKMLGSYPSTELDE